MSATSFADASRDQLVTEIEALRRRAASLEERARKAEAGPISCRSCEPIDGVNKRLAAEVEALRVLLDTLADDIYGEGRKAVLNGFAEGARRQWWLAAAGRDIGTGTGGAR